MTTYFVSYWSMSKAENKLQARGISRLQSLPGATPVQVLGSQQPACGATSQQHLS